MYRKARYLVLTAAIALGAGALASADTLTGQITKVNPKANALTVKNGKKTTSFKVSKDTKITLANSPSDLGSLKAGESVSVEFSTNRGKKVVSRVDAQNATGTGTSAAPAAHAEKPASAH